VKPASVQAAIDVLENAEKAEHASKLSAPKADPKATAAPKPKPRAKGSRKAGAATDPPSAATAPPPKGPVEAGKDGAEHRPEVSWANELAEIHEIPGRAELAEVSATSGAAPGTPLPYTDCRFTDMEKTLQALVVGGDRRWLHAPPPEAPLTQDLGDPVGEEEAQTRAAMAAIDADADVARLLQSAPELLEVNLRSLLLQARLEGKPATLVDAAGQLASVANPDLAEAAAAFLSDTLDQKAGSPPDGTAAQAHVGEIQWAEDHTVGRGKARLLERQWAMVDYGDRLPYTPPVLKALQPTGGLDYESRQCVLWGTAGVVAQSHPSKEPAYSAVLKVAQRLRLGFLTAAQLFLAAVGAAPVSMPTIEAELRAQAHDIVTANHEKDWRFQAAYRLAELGNVLLTVIRVDYWGRIRVEELLPVETQKLRYGYLLINQAHVRLLLRPDGLTHEQFHKELRAAGVTVESISAVGWEAMLDSAAGTSLVQAKEATRCQRCNIHRRQVLRRGRSRETAGETLGGPVGHPSKSSTGGPPRLPGSRSPRWGGVFAALGLAMLAGGPTGLAPPYQSLGSPRLAGLYDGAARWAAQLGVPLEQAFGTAALSDPGQRDAARRTLEHGNATVWLVAPHVTTFEAAWSGTRSELAPQGQEFGAATATRGDEAADNRSVRFAAELADLGLRLGKLVLVVGTDTATAPGTPWWDIGQWPRLLARRAVRLLGFDPCAWGPSRGGE